MALLNGSFDIPASVNKATDAWPYSVGPYPVSRPSFKPIVGALVAVVGLLISGEASAHVKWFCAFNVAGQPRGLENVLCPDFERLTGLAIVVLLAGCILERTVIGEAILRALDRVTSGLHSNTEVLLRGICGGFFVALWAMGGVLLTPELKTSSTGVPWLQLAIATGMLWRSTLPLSALGIVVLYAIAIRNYGVFHLMDYPILLGVAAYLTLTGLQRTLFGMRPLDVVRWSAAITLMWASIRSGLSTVDLSSVHNPPRDDYGL